MLVLVGAASAPAMYRAEQVRAAVKDLRLDYNGTAIGPVSISSGVAIYPQCGGTPAELIEAADKALYEAKHNGRDQVCEAPSLPAPEVKEDAAE